MIYSQYKFKFYLNASHSIYINGNLGQSHPHTWEISLNVLKVKEKFIQFHEVEKAIEAYLDKYQNTFINNIEPFNEINPTLENICEYFKGTLRDLLKKKGWVLMTIEISETPSRSYIIDLIDEVELNGDSDGEASSTSAADEILNIMLK